MKTANGAFLAIVWLLVSGMAAAQSSDTPVVVMTTSMGDITLELDSERAPQTVANFLNYVDDGFYEQTLFHRVIEGFMIQGGGFSTQYQRKTTRPPVNNEAYNGLRNRQYTIAMARTTAPHSATSQFFINSADNPNLDHTNTTQRGWGYAVFGKVVQGQEVVDEISRVRTGSGGPFSRDVPAEPIVIERITRLAGAPASALPAIAEPALPTPEGVDNVTSPIELDQKKRDNAVIQTEPVEQN